MVRQEARRDSRGWALVTTGWEEEVEVFGAEGARLRFERRVSWTPGAEGAPRVGTVYVGLLAAGTMRRAWLLMLVGRRNCVGVRRTDHVGG